MGGIAFDGIALRGEIGSKARHKNLKQMHKYEKEFNNEQELKSKNKATCEQGSRQIHKKQKPFLADAYYRLDTQDTNAFLTNFINLILDQMKDNINIITDSELKQGVDELTK